MMSFAKNNLLPDHWSSVIGQLIATCTYFIIFFGWHFGPDGVNSFSYSGLEFYFNNMLNFLFIFIFLDFYIFRYLAQMKFISLIVATLRLGLILFIQFHFQAACP